MFSSREFILSDFTCRSSIYFEFIFVYDIRECSNFLLLCIAVQFSKHHLPKSLYSIVYSCLLCCTLCCVLSHSVMSDSFVTPWTVARQAPLSMGVLQARILEWVACPPPGDLPNPGIKPRSPTLQAESLPSEPPGKPKNTGVGSPSLLQGNFLTNESNWGLLHCRQILYQLNHPGSPCCTLIDLKCMSLFLGFLSSSIDLYVCFCAIAILF